MHSAAVFKTKSVSLLLMLKSNQRKVLCRLQDVQQIKQKRFSKIEAARRVTSTRREIVFFQEKIDKLLKGRSSSNENSNRSKRKSENDHAPEAKMGKLENSNVFENINELLAIAEELNVVREIPKSEIKSKTESETGLVFQDGPKIKLVPIEQLRNRTYQIENLRKHSYP